MTHANLEPPTLSEVIRLLEKLETQLSLIQNKTISSEVYAADKVANEKAIAELKVELAKIRLDQSNSEKEALRLEREQSNQKRSQRWGYFAIVLSGIVAIYLAPFLRIPFER